MEKKNQIADGNPRTPNLGISLIPIVAIFVLLYGSLRIFHLDVQIPLIFASIIAAFIAVVILKNKWDTIEKGIIDSIQNAMQAILIACFIGMIIGSWIAGGIVPSLIYYGLKILSPKFFLVTCLLVCSIVAVATGSAWTTAGTLGVAMVGIGSGMGIPPAVTAGRWYPPRTSVIRCLRSRIPRTWLRRYRAPRCLPTSGTWYTPREPAMPLRLSAIWF